MDNSKNASSQTPSQNTIQTAEPIVTPTIKKSALFRTIPMSYGLIVLLIILLLISTSINYKLYNETLSDYNQQYSVYPHFPTPTPNLYPPTKCKYHQYLHKEDFLQTYTVQPGDTAYTIAKNVINEPSREDELISLNNDKYPQFTYDNPRLEPGWKIYLPPTEIASTSGYILTYQGIIINMRQDLWDVQVNDPTRSSPSEIYLGKYTKFANDKNDYKIGDCISALIDQGGKDKADNRAIFISHQ